MNDKHKDINVDKIVNHWRTTSKEDYKTMIDLYNSKTYHWALFICHISVEKLLKAYFVKTKEKQAPPIHNLYRLAELSGLEITDKHADWLDSITLFNLNARYDDLKREFYKQCTREYTKLWIEQISELRKWIEKKF